LYLSVVDNLYIKEILNTAQKEPMTDHEEKKILYFFSRYIKGYRDVGIKNT